jgi:hypothetical protein
MGKYPNTGAVYVPWLEVDERKVLDASLKSVGAITMWHNSRQDHKTTFMFDESSKNLRPVRLDDPAVKFNQRVMIVPTGDGTFDQSRFKGSIILRPDDEIGESQMSVMLEDVDIRLDNEKVTIAKKTKGKGRDKDKDIVESLCLSLNTQPTIQMYKSGHPTFTWGDGGLENPVGESMRHPDFDPRV